MTEEVLFITQYVYLFWYLILIPGRKYPWPLLLDLPGSIPSTGVGSREPDKKICNQICSLHCFSWQSGLCDPCRHRRRFCCHWCLPGCCWLTNTKTPQCCIAASTLISTLVLFCFFKFTQKENSGLPLLNPPLKCRIWSGFHGFTHVYLTIWQSCHKLLVLT